MKRVGDPPNRGHVYTRRPGAYAILPLGGQVLLTEQLGAEEPLQLPGGGIDAGESPVQALFREVFEETGWRISLPRRFGVFKRFVYMPEYDLMAEKLCHIYLARPVLRKSAPREPGHVAHWVKATELPDILDNPGDRLMALNWLSSR